MTLLHGKMTSAEKNKRLSEFSGGEKGKGLRVLVSTSIIEVRVSFVGWSCAGIRLRTAMIRAAVMGAKLGF